MTLADLVTPRNLIIFNYVICGLALVIIFAYVVPLLKSATVTPSPPTGWGTLDYNAAMPKRQPITAIPNLDITKQPMLGLTVATASFGGIFTESSGPYIGTVSPDAATLQVEAGARAMILDIWPNPADTAVPVVCSMRDNTQNFFSNWWINSGGLNQGTGRYSNWQMVTRNSVPALEIMTAACRAAFNPQNPQSGDPFFLILKLHGAMTVDYLNRLAADLTTATAGHELSPTTFGSAKLQNGLCTTPVQEFMGKVAVLIIPDIEPGYNSLPNINTHPKFTRAHMATRMADQTMVLEQAKNQVFFDVTMTNAVSTPSRPNCNATDASTDYTPAEVGFCVIQPSVGGASASNANLFSDAPFVNCVNTKAHFVGVNLFDSNSSDATLTDFFSSDYFGSYSFKKTS